MQLKDGFTLAALVFKSQLVLGHLDYRKDAAHHASNENSHIHNSLLAVNNLDLVGKIESELVNIGAV